MGQGPSTKVTHLRLNQPPVFPLKLELVVCTDGHMLLCGQDHFLLGCNYSYSMNVNSSKLWLQVCHCLIMTCDQLSDLCYQSYTQAKYLDSLVPSWSFSLCSQ